MTLSAKSIISLITMILSLIFIPLIMKYLFKQESVKTNALNFCKKYPSITKINIIIDSIFVVLFFIYTNMIFFIIFLIFSDLNTELIKLREQKI